MILHCLFIFPCLAFLLLLFLSFFFFFQAPLPEEHLQPHGLDLLPTVIWPISRGTKVSVVGVIVQATVIKAGSARVRVAG